MKLLALSTYCHLLYKTIIIYTGNEMEGAIETVSQKAIFFFGKHWLLCRHELVRLFLLQRLQNNTRNEHNEA